MVPALKTNSPDASRRFAISELISEYSTTEYFPCFLHITPTRSSGLFLATHLLPASFPSERKRPNITGSGTCVRNRGNAYTDNRIIDSDDVNGLDAMLHHVIDDGHRSGLLAVDGHRTLVERHEHSAIAVGRSGDGAARCQHDVTIIVNTRKRSLREEENLVGVKAEVRMTREK